MSKLEELIQKYCPDGVEYKPLWSLTAWDKKFNGIEDKSKQKKVIKYNYLLAADLKSYQVDGGTVKLLTTNISNLYTSEELAEGLASDGEVVAIPWGGNPVVQYYKGRFLTADNRIATSLDTTLLNNKFLYYCMLNQMKLISSFYRGSGIKHPEMAKVLDLEIPVPPLPVQEEIVRVLDTFTELQAELQAELQKRLQQYNYYRDNLLSFEGRKDVEWKKLGDVTDLLSGFPFDSTQFTNTGIRLMRGMNIKRGQLCFNEKDDRYWKSEEGLEKYIVQENDIVISMDGSLVGRSFGMVKKEDLPLLLVQRVARVRSSVFNINYIYHCINNWFPDYVDKKKTQGAIPHISMKDIYNFPIPAPSLEEQERIASILDRFETLTTDLSHGLPAEIEKRRQQYEFYRDKLLTFKRK